MDLLLMLTLLHIDLELVDLLVLYHYVFAQKSHPFAPMLVRCNLKVQDFAQSNDQILSSFVTKSKCFLYLSYFLLVIPLRLFLLLLAEFYSSILILMVVVMIMIMKKGLGSIPKPLFIFLNNYNYFICIGQFV